MNTDNTDHYIGLITDQFDKVFEEFEKLNLRIDDIERLANNVSIKADKMQASMRAVMDKVC